MENKNKKSSRIGAFVLLHVLMLIYSLDGIMSKLAGAVPFLSFKFVLYYGILIVILGIYAIGWQQVIKRLPLTTAFANKAVTVVWGIIWGALVFKEQITVGKVVGAVLVITGVVIYAIVDGQEAKELQENMREGEIDG